MPASSRSRLRWKSRALPICGVVWIISCWSWVLFSLSSLLSHTAPTTLPLPIEFAASDSMKQRLRDGSRSISPDVHNRNFSSVEVTNNVVHHHLRATAPAPELQDQPYHSNESAPLSSFVYPLHEHSGTHHAYLYVGTPPQRQTLIVDTGSRLTAFPCHPHCTDCGTHASKPFRLNISSSHTVVSCDRCKLWQRDFPLEDYYAGDGIGGNSGDGPSLRGYDTSDGWSNVKGYDANGRGFSIRRSVPKSCVNGQCGLDQKYTEGSSWKAFEVQDRIWLGLDDREASEADHKKHSTQFVFGCQVSEHGLFKTQYADGIMGLSMYTYTLAGIWHQEGIIPHLSFSLCMNRRGGHISLGGVGSTPDERKQQQGADSLRNHLSPMMFTPFAKENVWYYAVTVTSISVGERVLPKDVLKFVNDHKGTIVDSGTTDTFINHKVAKAFTYAWERITGRPYHNRNQKFNYQQFSRLPVIIFELEGGIQWEIKPESYMEHQKGKQKSNSTGPVWEGNRVYISRVYVDEPHGVVLGSNAMMDKEIYFDLANRRLGVAKATCLY
ncbi:hypothetical protein ACHAWF_012187 [Thalassiosira exigua]